MRSPNNLPPQLTTFIGREREIAEIARLLSTSRLLTLTGAGGSGKTRMALQVASQVMAEYPDGVFLVNLAPITDPNLVISTVAQTLGLKEEAGGSLIKTLKDYLQGKNLLLLLDNFEQVLGAAPVLVDLLTSVPSLKLFVTSRESLHLQGEKIYQVPPLELPDLKWQVSIEELLQNEAVALFMERARSASAHFRLTEQNVSAVAQICSRVDGLPLAIELAAARIHILSPQAMLFRLESRLKLLTGGASNLPARHHTLRTTIEWSYDLLEDDEKHLLSRLSVFVGGSTLEAVEAVCNDDGKLQMDLLDGVQSLVNKSLLQRREGSDEDPRFSMLETIREYARERLQESGETDDLGRGHAQYFLEFAEEAEPQLKGPRQVVWLDRLEAEHNNLRAALDWSQTTTSENGTEIGLRLASILWPFWEVRGYLTEGRERLARVLSHDAAAPHDREDRRRKVAQHARAEALNGAARLAYFQGDNAAARPLIQESVALFRELGDNARLAVALTNLGFVLMNLEDVVAARAAHEESLATRRALGGKRGIATGLANLGLMAAHSGDYHRAWSLLEEGLSLYDELSDKVGRAYTIRHLGFTAHSQGDYEQAGTLLRESLLLFWEQGHKRVVAECLAELAAISGGQGAPERAAKLFGAAQALYESLGASMWSINRPLIERDLAAAHAELDEDSWQRAWQEGHATTIEQAITYGLEPGPERMPRADQISPKYPDDLTEREVEVLRLIAAGKSNQEIAQELTLSRRTAERHVTNIYQKIGAAGKVARATATAYALRHNLST